MDISKHTHKKTAPKIQDFVTTESIGKMVSDLIIFNYFIILFYFITSVLDILCPTFNN